MSDIPTPEAPAVKPKRKKQPAQRKPQQRDPAIAAIYAEAKQKAAEHRKAQASEKVRDRVMALVEKLTDRDKVFVMNKLTDLVGLNEDSDRETGGAQ
mgnify:CR=1 FL=1